MNRLGAPASLPAIQPTKEHAGRDAGAPRSRGSWSQCMRKSERRHEPFFRIVLILVADQVHGPNAGFRSASVYKRATPTGFDRASPKRWGTHGSGSWSQCTIWQSWRLSMNLCYSRPDARMKGRNSFMSCEKISSETCCVPSLQASAGFGWTSMSRASAPMATAPLHIAITRSARPAP